MRARIGFGFLKWKAESFGSPFKEEKWEGGSFESGGCAAHLWWPTIAVDVDHQPISYLLTQANRTKTVDVQWSGYETVSVSLQHGFCFFMRPNTPLLKNENRQFWYFSYPVFTLYMKHLRRWFSHKDHSKQVTHVWGISTVESGANFSPVGTQGLPPWQLQTSQYVRRVKKLPWV